MEPTNRSPVSFLSTYFWSALPESQNFHPRQPTDATTEMSVAAKAVKTASRLGHWAVLQVGSTSVQRHQDALVKQPNEIISANEQEK